MLSPPELPVISSPRTSRDQGWRHAVARPSLPEIYRSLPIPESAGFLRKLLAFAGPGYLVAVGYMDPGNWATDLAGGSKYRLHAALGHPALQPDGHPAADPGHQAGGRDRPRPGRRPAATTSAGRCQFVLLDRREIAIAACDLAEVIGSAIALNLLFHIPLLWGVCLTALDVLLILFLQQKGFRLVEALVITLIGVIGVCFGLEILFSKPSMLGIAHGLLHPFGADRSRPGDALHRHRHPRRHGDAAQPVPALVDRADAQLRAHSEGQARGDSLRHHRLHHRAHLRVVRQRGHPDRGRRDVLQPRIQRRGRDQRRLQTAHAAARRDRRRAPCSRWRCWPPARTRR